jgi:hypothetical protein
MMDCSRYDLAKSQLLFVFELPSRLPPPISRGVGRSGK